MARHVDPDDNSFRRTLARAALGGLVALAVTAGITGALARTRAPGGQGPTVAFESPTAEPVTEEPEDAPPSELNADGGFSTITPTESATAAAEPTETEVPTEDVSTIQVQVLDGVGDVVRADDAQDVLTELGYNVVLEDAAAVEYAVTTVIYTSGNKDAAEALTRRDPRFTTIAPNTDLQAKVDLHVVVGADWPEPE